MTKYLQKSWPVALLALAVGLFLGYLFWYGTDANEPRVEHDVSEHADETTWTCSMHPQIRQSEPGQCPICGMDLIPLTEEDDDANPMAVFMTKTAAKLAGIQTMEVGFGAAEKSLRLNGTVVANEKLVKSQSAHVSGRVEQLFVNTTGEFVKRGQRLASLYSPELIAAQQELLQTATIKDSQPALYRAAVAKIKAFKLSEQQISDIVESGEIKQTINILADQTGIVLAKKINVGDYVGKGGALYTIADLSRVWVEFDAYESDLSWISVGDQVKFTVASLPGQQFEGKVTFIDPIVNSRTRVAHVRVETANPDRKLKPEMFATGIIQAQAGGTAQQMVLPKSAVMWTGERSVVYVKDETTEEPSFVLREVVLGPSLGGSYVVEEGLEPGDRVVINGTFTVDAAAQLAGKPSMMNLEGGQVNTGHQHGAGGEMSAMEMKEMQVEVDKDVKRRLEALITAYYPLKNALVAAEHQEAVRKAEELSKELNRLSMKDFKDKAHDRWMDVQPVIERRVKAIKASGSIDEARKHFIPLSEAMVVLARSFAPFKEIVYVQHCPMANDDQGADWLSSIEEIRNPYYGEMMLTCGEVSQTIK